MSHAKDTSVVDPANTPGTDHMMPEKLLNVPATLEDAVARIRALETALDDLNRASEIAQYSGQYAVTESFRAAATDLLATKIQVDHSDPVKINLTIITESKESDAA